MGSKCAVFLDIAFLEFVLDTCKIGKPFKERSFVADTGELYLLIRSISNLRKPVFNAMCVVSVFYANWAV
ncbi:hypothetical protein T01_15452, partial [Trichinella spiralis]